MTPAGTALLERRARSLAYATIAWNSIEAVVAVGAGIAAGSIALIGFGLDSLVEVYAGIVVLWRLRGTAEERERRARRLIAVSFFALTAYVVVEAVRELAVRSQAGESGVGIVLAAVSLAVMPALGLVKRRVAAQLQSRALLADAAETLLCSYLSGILLLGLALNAAVGWWWADPLAALGIAFLAFREGWEALEGEDHC